MTRVVVLGGGSTGEHFIGALRRLDADAEVVLVEERLVGGECSYYACMPTKTLLRATELSASLDRAPGLEPQQARPEDVWAWRDWMTSDWSDEGQLHYLEEWNVRLVRGAAKVVRPGVVEAGGEEIAYDRLVVATGSRPFVPPLEGLDSVAFWTNREATSAHEIPASLAVLGGGPVGSELAQFFARMGSRVTVVERGERLLGRVHGDAGEVIAAVFRSDGIDVRLGVGAERVEPRREDGVRIRLSDGSTVEAERLLVATGRVPNVDGLGLEQLGVEITRRGIVVDERLRAADNVWALGDANGIALFTHVGKYQARVAAADIAGRDVKADYRAIPAGIFTDPEVGTVGRTEGDDLVSVRYELSGVPRLSTYEKPARAGFVRLFAERKAGSVTGRAGDARPKDRAPSARLAEWVLVGAVCVGPQAAEWLGQLTLAVRAATPVDVLLDTTQPYPTFSEGVFFAVRELADALATAP